jgi:hypothetical protein
MAKYKAKNLAETAAALRIIKKKNSDMIRKVRGSELARVAMQAGFIVEARAKEILTEKGHVVTGNLRRSINTQLVSVGTYSATVQVGTFVVYGPYIENLPDGGFLFPASIQTFPEVSRFLNERGIVPILKAWGQ